MSTHRMMRVTAVEGRSVPHLNDAGHQTPGRYVGRDHLQKHAAVPVGVLVPRTAYYLNAVRDGDLVEAPEAPEAQPENTVKE